ncbi:MAG: hypothetical protein AAGB31_00450 [Bdellovibrio sp.]
MSYLSKMFLSCILCLGGFGSIAFADEKMVAPKAIAEDDVTFTYASNDGTIRLKCTHYFAKPDAHDWDVWCGKGTPLFRTFRVHFLVRQFENTETKKSAFEILYWVIDRDQPIQKSFSSTSSWIQFRNLSDLELLSFSQSVENDYASLKVDLRL